jgi:hypothetical protein
MFKRVSEAKGLRRQKTKTAFLSGPRLVLPLTSKAEALFNPDPYPFQLSYAGPEPQQYPESQERRIGQPRLSS